MSEDKCECGLKTDVHDGLCVECERPVVYRYAAERIACNGCGRVHVHVAEINDYGRCVCVCCEEARRA